MNKQEIKLKAMIVDDSPQACRLLKMMILEESLPVDVVSEAHNAFDAWESIQNLKPDLLFLDIEMPEKSGLELAEQILEHDINCEIIFTTAYSEYAIQAFRLSAIDYLLKPIQEGDLKESIEKVKYKKKLTHDQTRLKTLTQNLKEESPQNLCVPILNGYEYIQLQDIEYIEADGAYVNITLCNTKQMIVSKNLRYFENLLEGFGHFLRVHRSYIVNKNHIKKVLKGEKAVIVMQSNQQIDLARDRKQAFWAAME
ncbi:hypothetical protein AD998_13420 [bacterium 336/3]|nr:hypothetical protein AD998_13420 [bacterium 336/3]